MTRRLSFVVVTEDIVTDRQLSYPLPSFLLSPVKHKTYCLSNVNIIVLWRGGANFLRT
jgi:hypothetical protein